MRTLWPFDVTCLNESDRVDLIHTLELAHTQGRQVFFEEPDVFGGVASDGREVRISKQNGWDVTVSGIAADDAVHLSYGVNSKWAFDFFLRCLADPAACVELEADKEYWPLPTLLPVEELTAEHRKQLAFLDRAFRQGFESYVYRRSSFGARASNGREGLLIFRGSRWLVDLFLGGNRVASKMVNDFDDGANFVMKWLNDNEVPEGFTSHESS